MNYTMRKWLKRILPAAIMLMILCFSCMPVSHAQHSGSAHTAYQLIPVGVGNHNSYSGGSRSGSSGGSAAGDIISFPLIFITSDMPPLLKLFFLGIVVVGIIGYHQYRSRKKREYYSDPEPEDAYTVSASQLARYFSRPAVSPARKIQEQDPNFSETSFLSWAGDIFITLNTAWTKQDWKLIRPFESDALFLEHSQQLDEYIRNGTVNYIERAAVKESFIDRFYTDVQYEYIVVKLHTCMVDYVKETATGKIIAGDITTLWDMVHTMTFMRTIGTKTQAHSESLAASNCPNCGAPIELNLTGECSYCKSIITSGKFNWVLCGFTGQNI